MYKRQVLVPPFLGEQLAAWLVDGYIYEIDSNIPVPDVEVWFYDYEAELSYCCTTDLSGHYEVPLPAGDWEAWPQADCWDFDPYMRAFSISGAAVTLDPFYAIPGG